MNTFLVTLTTSLLIIVSNLCNGQVTQLQETFWDGDYLLAIQQSDSLLKVVTTNSDSIAIYQVKADAYLQLEDFPNHLSVIKIKKRINYDKLYAETLFSIEKANYFHNKLRMDSSLHYAHLAKDILLPQINQPDSFLMYSVYSKHANCCRNNDSVGSNLVAPIGISLFDKYSVLSKCQDTAMLYVQNDYQLADVLRKKGVICLDYIAHITNLEDTSIIIDTVRLYKVLAEAEFNYGRSISLSKSSTKKGSAKTLLGLIYYYLKDYEKSNQYYQKGIDFFNTNPKNNLSSLLLTYNWKGWNLTEWYESTGKEELLDMSISLFKANYKLWKRYSNTFENGNHDGYRVNAVNKLSIVLYKKFLISSDSSHLHESFFYSDLGKQPYYSMRSYSIKEIQNTLESDEVFIQNVTTQNTYKELCFIISQDSIKVILSEDFHVSLSYVFFEYFYKFKKIETFKKTSYRTYRLKFERIDDYLKQINLHKVIMCNSDFNALLNYDILISDTTFGTWKDQPYLFHRYNFSYALCARSYLNSSKSQIKLPTQLGVTVGNYDENVNLRFSKKLGEELQSNYFSVTDDFYSNLSNNNVVMVLSHGNSEYTQNVGEIVLSDNVRVSANELYKSDLKNNLVIITTCNSNSSLVNYGEGSTGNFSKALRYAGAQSTLTSSWEIDDKANAVIMAKFIGYLSFGLNKNDALWKAKKDYWTQASQEEEFKPLYWASYVLTGDINSVRIKKKKPIRYAWFGLVLIIPLGIVGWKKRVAKG